MPSLLPRHLDKAHCIVMEIGAKNLAMVHRFNALSILESIGEISERGRNASTACRGLGEEDLICPKPRHAMVTICQGVPEASKPTRKLRGHAAAEGEAGHEILDILFSKVNAGDVASSGSPIRYFFGSPPSRAGNPVIHDVHFSQGRSPIISQKSPRKPSPGSNKSSSLVSKSLCSSSPYGSKPFVRIEGFASSTAEAQHGVPSCA